jgi:hypothetical protein
MEEKQKWKKNEKRKTKELTVSVGSLSNTEILLTLLHRPQGEHKFLNLLLQIGI